MRSYEFKFIFIDPLPSVLSISGRWSIYKPAAVVAMMMMMTIATQINRCSKSRQRWFQYVHNGCHNHYNVQNNSTTNNAQKKERKSNSLIKMSKDLNLCTTNSIQFNSIQFNSMLSVIMISNRLTPGDPSSRHWEASPECSKGCSACRARRTSSR